MSTVAGAEEHSESAFAVDPAQILCDVVPKEVQLVASSSSAAAPSSQPRGKNHRRQTDIVEDWKRTYKK